MFIINLAQLRWQEFFQYVSLFAFGDLNLIVTCIIVFLLVILTIFGYDYRLLITRVFICFI